MRRATFVAAVAVLAAAPAPRAQLNWLGLVDKAGVARLDPVPYIALMGLGMAALLAPRILADRSALVREWRVNRVPRARRELPGIFRQPRLKVCSILSMASARCRSHLTPRATSATHFTSARCCVTKIRCPAASLFWRP